MIFSSINFLIFWFFSLILHRFVFFNTIGIAGIVGIIFYSFQGISNLAALLSVAATCYVFCRVRKYFILFSLLLFTPLFLFKYLEIISFFQIPITEFMIVNFINAPVPPGLSFATFSAFALLVLCKNFDENVSSLKTITGYLFFFPQLIAGPIVMPRSLIPQLRKFAPVKIDNILKGVFIFSIGFALKAIFADSIALYVDLIFSNISNSNFQDIIIATLLFSQQIFFDFNGYTIMAIGIAYSFGISLPENFNAPYLSTSISDFWKRWHMTLSNWIRDFIYIPLGGSKCSKLRNYLNLLIAMLISGIWHGYGMAFVIWGFLHGSFIILEKIFTFKFIPKFIKILLTYFLVSFLWIFFRVDNFGDLAFIFNFSNINFLFNQKIILIIILCLFLNYLQKFLTINILNKIFNRTNKYILITISIFIIIFCIVLSEGSTQKFIYFNF